MYCRICNDKDVEAFYFDTPIFPLRNKNEWNNYYCKFCHCVSHFNSKNKKTRYSDSTYRKRDIGFQRHFKKKNISPPIDLPWSTVTFLRWENIASLIEDHIDKVNIKNSNYLDFGGYNGLTAFGLREFFNLKNVTIADLDLKGLNFAKNLGFSTIK